MLGSPPGRVAGTSFSPGVGALGGRAEVMVSAPLASGLLGTSVGNSEEVNKHANSWH